MTLSELRPYELALKRKPEVDYCTWAETQKEKAGAMELWSRGSARQSTNVQTKVWIQALIHAGLRSLACYPNTRRQTGRLLGLGHT